MCIRDSKYTAKADVGGKLAQLGSRLIVSTSKKLAKNFFEEFNLVLVGEEEGVGEVSEEKKGFWKTLIGG